MDVLVVRSNGQITIPSGLRRAINIREGDLLAAEVEDGALVLRPKILVDKDQAYFYTRRWQAGERAAEEDIQQGRVRRFADARQMVQTMAREVGLDPAKIEEE